MLHLTDANVQKTAQGKLSPIFGIFPLRLAFLSGSDLCCIHTGKSQVENPSILIFKLDSFI
jgi:hypothetical protein